jgi:hypothetical protein
LRFVRKGMMVVLGLISSKIPQFEAQNQLWRRIDEAAKYVPLEGVYQLDRKLVPVDWDVMRPSRNGRATTPASTVSRIRAEESRLGIIGDLDRRARLRGMLPTK